MTPIYGSRWFEVEDVGEVTVVRLKTPFLDEETVRGVFDTLDCLVAVEGRHKLVLDLAAVQSLGSLALCRLVKLNHKVRAFRGRLTLCQLSPPVTTVLESTLLTRFFNIRCHEQDALQSCS